MRLINIFLSVGPWSKLPVAFAIDNQTHQQHVPLMQPCGLMRGYGLYLVLIIITTVYGKDSD